MQKTFPKKPACSFDVVIIGGGITGLTLAAALAATEHTQECTIAIVDNHPMSGLNAESVTSAPPADLRVSAINHASEAIFASVNAWEAMKSRLSTYEKMMVWDARSPARIEFDCTEIGQPYLGHIIEHA